MNTPLTPPTPENVAEMLTSGDNDYHDGNDWWPSIGCDGNVIDIGITPVGEDYETKLPEVRFRAVIAEVSEDAVIDGPLTLMTPPDGRVLIDLTDFSNLLNLSPEQAYAAAAQLIAAVAVGGADSSGGRDE